MGGQEGVQGAALSEGDVHVSIKIKRAGLKYEIGSTLDAIIVAAAFHNLHTSIPNTDLAGLGYLNVYDFSGCTSPGAPFSSGSQCTPLNWISFHS